MARIATVGWIGLAAALALGAAGCNRSQTQSQEPDPASANLAPADQSGQPAQDQTAAAPAQEAQYQGSPEQLSEAPQPPPPLPDYSQPPCPGDNYLWTPGYWGYSQAGYYWAPGAWVTAPFVGALWTPSYWGFSGGHYLWHAGYWGTARGILWRHQLRLRLYRPGILGRVLGEWRIQLQPLSAECGQRGPSRVRPRGGQLHAGQSH